MFAAPNKVESHGSLVARLTEARKQTDRIFGMVRPDSLYERPIPERHRIVFYIGHLEAFDWNLLLPRLSNVRPFDAALDRLFAFGIDPVDGALPSDQPSDWPAIADVRRYAGRIRQELDAALASTDVADWSGEESSSLILNVAIEHRLMHAETLAYMLHQLPPERRNRESEVSVTALGQPTVEFRDAELVEIPEGAATLGLARDAASFGWDNEYESHVVQVPSFSIERYKVTNGQYLRFMEAGGYENPEFWSPEGCQWKEAHGITHPAFWKPSPDGWHLRAMFDEIPLPLDWPVYVSHAEAAAYARWTGRRLPSEAEWHRAAYGNFDGPDRAYPWGAEPPGPHQGYFDLARWDPWPVNAFPHSGSAFGVEGLLANGWEWTSTLFAPFPGFRPFPFYEGYSANFFDGQHYVMKGGSPRTARSMLRHSFRNWFQPHYQYVYGAFRCVR